MKMVFLDSAYPVALIIPRDPYHEKAKQAAIRLRAENPHLITTRAVILEIGNALGKIHSRPQSVRLLESLSLNESVEIVSLTENLFEKAFNLYRQRLDKTWGMTDCVSFVVMRERGITEALTSDSDFEQAGFVALLR